MEFYLSRWVILQQSISVSCIYRKYQQSLNVFPCCEPGRSNLRWQQWNKYLSKESTFFLTFLLKWLMDLMDLYNWWDCRIAHLWNQCLGKTNLQLEAQTCTLEMNKNIYSLWEKKSIKYFKVDTRHLFLTGFFPVSNFILCILFHYWLTFPFNFFSCSK